jgi:riboflavin kinase/FMN adenylyltransferase
LLVGYDFALGRGRVGTVARLTELGAEFGYSLRSFAPVSEAGEPVSSSRIRAVLADGAVEQAALLLGRPHFLEGPVVHGDGRGRTINIPTANLQVPEEKALPANGVYACRAWVEGVAHAAVTNVGVRPTFATGRPDPHVEAHLLDYARDLYGLPVRLEFIARLRGERKFPSVEALIAQIRADIQTARGIL